MNLPYQPKKSEILPNQWNLEKKGILIYVTKGGHLWFGNVETIYIRSTDIEIIFDGRSQVHHSDEARFFTDLDDALAVLKDKIKAQVEGKNEKT